MAMSEAILAAFADGDSTIDGRARLKNPIGLLRRLQKIGGVTYEI
ncbi:MAG: hypothetical protein ACLUSP_03020 [Christensenellales bacterium]